ncbi:hypothetical protein MTO96_005681 [Rhipicephalus appendiculatus]
MPRSCHKGRRQMDRPGFPAYQLTRAEARGQPQNKDPKQVVAGTCTMQEQRRVGDGSQHDADDVLKETSVLALYFSAGWCPGCRMFTPVLAEAYRQNKSPKVEVVFVSSDHSIFAMMHFMRQSHANWFAVKELPTKYGITRVPALVVVRRDGSVINADARVDVMTRGHRAFLDWLASS